MTSQVSFEGFIQDGGKQGVQLACGLGFVGHSQAQRRFPLSLKMLLRACKQILMRFYRRTTAATIAGMARKRGRAAPPLSSVSPIGSVTKEIMAVMGQTRESLRA
jgi:hypothetical protein